jgi:aminoglycoside phosphotransferase (APT) family kinase protein
MTNEKNIMYSEVHSMQMVAKKIDIPVAKILFYDNTHEICDADYFFMEKLKGQSFNSLLPTLDEQTIKNINFEIGKYTKILNSIEGNVFGYYGYTEKQGTDWFEVFKSMIRDLIEDGQRLKIDFKQDVNMIYDLLNQDKSYFEEVTTPRLVHWDLWAGNIFIDNGIVSGLIDFERCMWADPLFEVGFRTFCYNEEFYKGYGITNLTENEIMRKEWYDIYFALIACLECDYRNYETNDAYEWGTSLLDEYIGRRKEKSL